MANTLNRIPPLLDFYKSFSDSSHNKIQNSKHSDDKYRYSKFGHSKPGCQIKIFPAARVDT